MALSKTNNVEVYGLSQAIVTDIPKVIRSKRAPTSGDVVEVGTLWVNVTGNAAYYCTRVVAGVATWSVAATTAAALAVAADLTVGTTATIGTGLTVSAGGAAITGNSTVTGTFAASTTITAGTTLASTTSTSVGTSLAVGTTITATLGNITATNGEFVSTVATKGLRLGAAGPTITAGAGAPAAVVAKGSVYLRTDGASADEVLYVATDAAGTWVALTST